MNTTETSWSSATTQTVSKSNLTMGNFDCHLVEQQECRNQDSLCRRFIFPLGPPPLHLCRSFATGHPCCHQPGGAWRRRSKVEFQWEIISSGQLLHSQLFFNSNFTSPNSIATCESLRILQPKCPATSPLGALCRSMQCSSATFHHTNR